MPGFLDGLWIRLGIAALLIALAVAGGLTWEHHIYMNGWNDHVAKVEKDVEAQKAADQAHKDKVAEAIIPIQLEAQTKLDISASQLPATVKYVQVIVHDNPTFAACLRPAALARLRETQREALRAESAAGPFPARSGSTQLPAAYFGTGQLAAWYDRGE